MGFYFFLWVNSIRKPTRGKNKQTKPRPKQKEKNFTWTYIFKLPKRLHNHIFKPLFAFLWKGKIEKLFSQFKLEESLQTLENGQQQSTFTNIKIFYKNWTNGCHNTNSFILLESYLIRRQVLLLFLSYFQNYSQWKQEIP